MDQLLSLAAASLDTVYVKDDRAGYIKELTTVAKASGKQYLAGEITKIGPNTHKLVQYKQGERVLNTYIHHAGAWVSIYDDDGLTMSGIEPSAVQHLRVQSQESP